MKKLIMNSFDDFIFNARVMPAISAGLPIVSIGVYDGLVIDSWGDAGINFLIAFVLITFLSYIAREWGKSYEEKMFESLGGMPTTIILRFSDSKIDVIRKIKYHKWFNNHFKDISLPLSLEEEQNISISDEKYISAMAYLRVYANSHRDKFPRVYQELKKYNFWRNIYGCKVVSVITYLIFIFREILKIKVFDLKEMIEAPFPKYIVLLGLMIWLIMFCSMVTKKTVERNAFDYAITLLETIENLD